MHMDCVCEYLHMPLYYIYNVMDCDRALFSVRQKKSQLYNLELNVFTHKAKNVIITQQSIIILYAI